MYNSFLLVVFISFTVREGESIKCYICDSKVNSRCANSTAVSNTMNATRCTFETIPEQKRFILGIMNKDDPISYNCLKYVITENGNKTVVRECTRAKTRQIDPCYYFKTNVEYAKSITKTDIKVDTCEVCTKDNCNGGVTTASSASATFSVLLSCLVVFSSWFGA